MTYFVILPIVVLSVSFGFHKLAVSVNEKDTDKIKAELFFIVNRYYNCNYGICN